MGGVGRQEHAGTVGTDVDRAILLREIVGNVEGLDPAGTDDDLDCWWGLVEVDRLASGLTLATIAKLMAPGAGDEPAGPWLARSGATEHEVTKLTAGGREAVRRIGSAGTADPSSSDRLG